MVKETLASKKTGDKTPFFTNAEDNRRIASQSSDFGKKTGNPKAAS
jgi:hypothetical protein